MDRGVANHLAGKHPLIYEAMAWCLNALLHPVVLTLSPAPYE